MSTRITPWGKGGWCVGLRTLPPFCADYLEIWKPQLPGTFRSCPGLLQGLFYLYLNRSEFQAMLIRYLQVLKIFVHMKRKSVFKFSLKHVKLYGTKYSAFHNVLCD
jgi:hypothetical protein